MIMGDFDDPVWRLRSFVMREAALFAAFGFPAAWARRSARRFHLDRVGSARPAPRRPRLGRLPPPPPARPARDLRAGLGRGGGDRRDAARTPQAAFGDGRLSPLCRLLSQRSGDDRRGRAPPPARASGSSIGAGAGADQQGRLPQPALGARCSRTRRRTACRSRRWCSTMPRMSSIRPSFACSTR